MVRMLGRLGPRAIVAAVGGAVALAALLFATLFEVRSPTSLGAVFATLLAGDTSLSGLDVLDLVRKDDGLTRDPVAVGLAVGAAAALLVLLVASRPALARLVALAGLAGVGAAAILPRLADPNGRRLLSAFVASADPGVGFYGALGGLALVVVGASRGGGRTG